MELEAGSHKAAATRMTAHPSTRNQRNVTTDHANSRASLPASDLRHDLIDQPLP